jgi:trehalose 6-phosphate synthase/phosphatase
VQNLSRVIVVSNRLPYTLKRAGEGWRTEKSSGGLTTALSPILKRTSGIWIGWSGERSGVFDARREQLLSQWAKRDRYYVVDLAPDIAHGFYEGYSNQTIWPLFHQFPSRFLFDPAHWSSYVRANELFRDEILKVHQPGDLIWIHDYHLMLLPRLVRDLIPNAAIGYFLHIPFPSSSIFRVLPKREELLRGLLGADYLAFHTHRYLQHFRGSILRLLGLGSELDRIEVGGRCVRLEALPIGIAPREFSDPLERDEETKRRLQELRDRFKGCKLILGVDRLDYTKGIPERLRAFHRFLTRWPEWHGKVVLIQVAVPSREHVNMYKRLRTEVDELIGKINGEWSTPDWTPVVYLRRNLPRPELTALYARADVALITALRDGLNLVAKEYIACKHDGDGVLLLSEFAGAAAEMGEAIMINPYDEERTAEAIHTALSMSPELRHERMSALYRRVEKNNVFAWSHRFVTNLEKAAHARADRLLAEGQLLPIDEVLNAFRKSCQRLLLLDYDGTLVPYSKLPQTAMPSPQLLATINQLSQDEKTTVAIVSGRSRADLERWFGALSNAWLAAEHGAILRPPATSVWEQPHHTQPLDWQKRVLPVLDHFVERTPGSFIEVKEFSLVWHYRMSDPEFGEWLANELVANLEQMLADTQVRAVKGQKSVEVKLVWANKGELYARLGQTLPRPDFILAAGDDVTDEDLFAQVPADAWTIHIGTGYSRARYRLAEPKEMSNLLDNFRNALGDELAYRGNEVGEAGRRNPGYLPRPAVAL